MERRTFFKLAGISATALAGASVLYGCDSLSGSPESDSDADTESAVSVGVPINFTEEVDVLIIGSGIAGLSAAMNPSEAGHSVIVAEKLELLGGESYDATGMIYTAETSIQKDAGITTTLDDAWKNRAEDFKKRNYTDRIAFEEILYKASSEWVDRIVSDYGSRFRDPTEYGEKDSFAPFLLPEGGLGDMASIMAPIRDQLVAQGVSFMLDMRAYMFILDEQSVPVGVRFSLSKTNTIVDVKAKKIIIATGGYICNQAFVREYVPSQAKLACYTTHADGSGHELCQAIQGTLSGMETIAPPISDLPQVDAWGYFGPLIDVSPLGTRIAREDQLGLSALACAEEEFGFWWTIFDETLSENGRSRSVSHVTSQNKSRMAGPCETLEDLATATGLPLDALKATFEDYQEAVKTKKDHAFGKTSFLQTLTPPYYAAKQFPNRFKSFGGVLTDDNAQIVDTLGNPLPNVYCCGACGAGSYSGLSSHGAFGIIAGRSVVAALEAEESQATDGNSADASS